ncbi:MAG: hypothetical protein WA584_13680 [Pyrinomonadaceae bacterium]
MRTLYYEIPGISGVEEKLEETRRHLAYTALGGFLGILVLVIIIGWAILKAPVDEVLKIITTIAGILGGVVGAIIGFYFRSKE